MAPTRRQILQGAVPAVLGFTGCLSSDGPGRRGHDETTRRDDRSAVENSGTAFDIQTVKPRNPDGRRVVEAPHDGTGVGFLIGSTEEADALTFKPGVPAEDASATREFLAATDFAEETVYVKQIRIKSCDQYTIQSVSWQHEHIEYEYCWELRPPDERCAAETHVGMAIFIRLPAVVDMESPSGGASGQSPCKLSAIEWAVIESNATTNDTATPVDDTTGEDR